MSEQCDKEESFWKSTFSKEGCQSWGRMAAAYLLVLGSAWVTRLVMLIKGPEQYDKLGAVGIFLGVLVASAGSLYTISKGLDVRMEKAKEDKGGAA